MLVINNIFLNLYYFFFNFKNIIIIYIILYLQFFIYYILSKYAGNKTSVYNKSKLSKKLIRTNLFDKL